MNIPIEVLKKAVESLTSESYFEIPMDVVVIHFIPSDSEPVRSVRPMEEIPSSTIYKVLQFEKNHRTQSWDLTNIKL